MKSTSDSQRLCFTLAFEFKKCEFYPAAISITPGIFINITFKKLNYNQWYMKCVQVKLWDLCKQLASVMVA